MIKNSVMMDPACWKGIFEIRDRNWGKEEVRRKKFFLCESL